MSKRFQKEELHLAIRVGIFLAGILMAFKEETRMIAPFIIGVGAGSLLALKQEKK